MSAYLIPKWTCCACPGDCQRDGYADELHAICDSCSGEVCPTCAGVTEFDEGHPPKIAACPQCMKDMHLARDRRSAAGARAIGLLSALLKCDALPEIHRRSARQYVDDWDRACAAEIAAAKEAA